MFMSIGKRTPRRRQGYVAEYCPICRDVRVCSLHSVASGWHINFIPLGPAKVVGHELWCESCGAVYEGNPGLYSEVSRQPTSDALSLAARTSPDLMDRCRERFDLDDAILSGTIDPALREPAIREPFELLNASIDIRMKSPSLDAAAWAALAIGLLGAAAFAGAIILRSTNGGPRTGLGTIGGIGAMIALFGFFTAAGRAASAYSRYIRRQAQPALAKCLAPLDPSLDELKRLRKDLRRDKCISHHALDPKRLHALIQAARRP